MHVHTDTHRMHHSQWPQRTGVRNTLWLSTDLFILLEDMDSVVLRDFSCSLICRNTAALLKPRLSYFQTLFSKSASHWTNGEKKTLLNLVRTLGRRDPPGRRKHRGKLFLSLRCRDELTKDLTETSSDRASWSQDPSASWLKFTSTATSNR